MREGPLPRNRRRPGQGRWSWVAPVPGCWGPSAPAPAGCDPRALDGQRPLGWRGWRPARPHAGDQTPRTLRQPRGPWGWRVRVHALPGWPLGGAQGAVPRRPQEVRAAAPLNRSGWRLRAWLRVSDAGPGPPPARLGVAEPAPGERRAEAADLCPRRRLRLGQGRGSQTVVKLEGQDHKPRRWRKTTGCKRVDWQGLACLHGA